MQTMFKDKGKTIENSFLAEIKVVNVSINMVDVHVAIQNKVIKEHVFKNQEPIKNKIVIDQEVEEKLKKYEMETIQQM